MLAGSGRLETKLSIKMLKIVCWRQNWSRTQTSLWLSLPPAHRRSGFSITAGQGYHFLLVSDEIN